MAINKISDETKRFIKKKTASALPDRPGDFNIKASEIKSFLHQFVTDDDNSIFSEIDRVVDEVNLRTADIENTSSDNLDIHKNDTSAHNIPSQIDSEINTHNQSGSSHQDLRTGLSEVQSVATSNKSKLDTIEVGATGDQTPAEIKTAYELNANTNAFTDSDKMKLNEIEEQAQVNKIESIIINGVTQAIVSKGINLTDDIKEMIDNEIDLLIGSSPETLDTLKELADALGNDPNFATTVTNEIASKISKDFTNYLEKENLTGTEHLIINDNGTIKKVKSDLVRNDKLTAENIPSGKGTTVSEELDKKVDIDLIETQLPDNLVYSDDLETVEEPLIQVYNSQLLNDKQESELDVNSAVKDGDNNVIADTYYKKTDTVDNSTNSENADKLLQDGSYVGSQFLNVAHASNASKLGGKLESELNVNSALTSNNALNSNKLNNKTESELNVKSARINPIYSTKPISKIMEVVDFLGVTFSGKNIWYYNNRVICTENGINYLYDNLGSFNQINITNTENDFIGANIWTDGTDTYYSYKPIPGTVVQKVLIYNPEGDTNFPYKWVDKSWNGFNNFSASDVWTDGEDLFITTRNNNENYIFDRNLNSWEQIDTTGLEDSSIETYGANVWSDGFNTFLSADDGTVGSDKNFYHYQLIKNIYGDTTYHWETKNWNIEEFEGKDIYATSNDIFCGFTAGFGTFAYILNNGSWSSIRVWNRIVSGENVWTDGFNLFYSFNGYHYKLKDTALNIKTRIEEVN